MLGFLQRFRRDASGAIGVLGALVLVSVIGVSALALEYGHALLERSENQRVADLAAYGGALVYNSSGDSTADAQSAAANIAALNGISGSGVTVTPSVVSSPTGDGNSAVEVAVTTDVPLLLARALTTDTTVPVTATSWAEINANAPACILALGGTGITMDGGTNVSADDCTVAADNTLTLSGGAKLVTQFVDYGTTAPSVSGGASIAPPSGKTLHENNVHVPDPLAGNSAVAAATGRITAVSAITSPSAPSVPSGTSYTFKSKALTGLPGTCSDSYASSVHTVTCTGSGPFDFGSVSVGGGVAVTVSNSSAGATYNFSGTVNATTSNGLTFNGGASAIYNMAAGVITGGGAPMSFSAGTFNIGTTNCSSAPSPNTGYSICDSSALTIGGPSTFVLAGGIYVSGGATLSLGSGTTNSYDIGAAGDSYSIYAGGGAVTTLADATGNGSLFQTAGNIANAGSSSGCLTIPAAAEHDIKGYVSLSCGATLGSGTYTVADYMALGASGGGGTVTGNNVTLVIGGASVPSSGTCSGMAFCVAAGFGNVTLTAPSSGTAKNLLVIGPTSSSANPTAGALFTEGSSNTTLTGAFYLPNGAVSMGGSGTINSSGGCLELIGSQVALTGGSAAASTCAGLGGGSTGTTVSLVQ